MGKNEDEIKLLDTDDGQEYVSLTKFYLRIFIDVFVLAKLCHQYLINISFLVYKNYQFVGRK